MIMIEDVNESPTMIELVSTNGQLKFPKNAARVNENSPAGTIVGTLTAYDQDAVESLTFSLDNDADGAFAVESSTSCSNASVNGTSPHTVCSALLKVNGALNYEKDTQKSIIVRVTDSKGLHHTQLFNVNIMDKNDKPTDIILNGLYTGFVSENENSELIGSLQTKDEDNGQLYRYAIYLFF